MRQKFFVVRDNNYLLLILDICFVCLFYFVFSGLLFLLFVIWYIQDEFLWIAQGITFNGLSISIKKLYLQDGEFWYYIFG